jgi:hypothetical protein
MHLKTSFHNDPKFKKSIPYTIKAVKFHFNSTKIIFSGHLNGINGKDQDSLG